jgi:hypothetical protein
VLGMHLEIRRGGYSYIVARVAADGHELELSCEQITQINGIRSFLFFIICVNLR